MVAVGQKWQVVWEDCNEPFAFSRSDTTAEELRWGSLVSVMSWRILSEGRLWRGYRNFMLIDVVKFMQTVLLKWLFTAAEHLDLIFDFIKRALKMLRKKVEKFIRENFSMLSQFRMCIIWIVKKKNQCRFDHNNLHVYLESFVK